MSSEGWRDKLEVLSRGRAYIRMWKVSVKANTFEGKWRHHHKQVLPLCCAQARTVTNATLKSLLSVTVFENKNPPLTQILTLIYCSVHRFSCENAMRKSLWVDVKLSSATVAHWYEMCREACISWVDRLERSGKIVWPTSNVESDEAIIGRGKYSARRLVQGTWVLSIVEGNAMS
jgi:hypothetical protein